MLLVKYCSLKPLQASIGNKLTEQDTYASFKPNLVVLSSRQCLCVS